MERAPRKYGSGYFEEGFSLIELLLVCTLIAILATIALPGFINAKKAANESAAISALRTLSSAQSQYRTRFGTYGPIADLIASTTIDASFSDGTRGGYNYAAGPISTDVWAVTATPVDAGISGDRSFFVDETGVIRFSQSGAATSADQAIE